MMEFTQLSLNQLTVANLMVAIKVEDFKLEDGNDMKKVFEAKGKDVLTIADDFLPDNPVFVLTAGESHRLCITFVHDHMVQVPIKRIVSVGVILPKPTSTTSPERETVDLDTIQKLSDGMRCEAVALLDPQALEYERLLTPSPMQGEVNAKYVPLELVMKVSMSDDGTQAFELKHKIYCQVVPPGHKSRLTRFTRTFKKQWERFPQWMRDGARASIFLANLSMNFH